MAWKEYSELKPEDKRHEDVRQKMIVCQSCSERATKIVTERPAFRDDKDLDCVALIKEIANELVDWVYEKANEQDTKPTSVSLPTPTAAQAKVLSKIAAELKLVGKGLDAETLKSKVLGIAEKDYNIRKFPENISSVDAFVKALK